MIEKMKVVLSGVCGTLTALAESYGTICSICCALILLDLLTGLAKAQIVSRSPAGLGSSPTSIFAGPPATQNSRCGHTCPACRFVQARKWVQKTEARALYASSVSLAAFIAWMVASTIFNSFSSREPSMASIRFLHSLPLFLDG